MSRRLSYVTGALIRVEASLESGWKLRATSDALARAAEVIE